DPPRHACGRGHAPRHLDARHP
ncbi:MAG: hypothetical protein AVDCRST_MAG15-266, partial [uncultured Rubellimicrobium sp.]